MTFDIFSMALLNFMIILATAGAVEGGAEPSFIGTLGLNWKLFLGQLINFSIILFILWRWVFKPIASALEGRRLKIEQSLKQAEDIKQRIAEFENTKEQELKKAKGEGDKILKDALSLALEVKQETLSQAKVEAGRIMIHARETIEAEKHQMLKEVRGEISSLTVLATEKILREKLDSEKDKALIQDVLKIIK